MTFFESLEMLPDDPILKVPILFAADSRKQKVNLGIGAYKNAQGQPQVLSSVRQAEDRLYQSNLNKEYLPIQGEQNFISECLKLIFGSNCEALTENRIFAAQTVGATSALRIGGDLFVFNKISDHICVADPTWPNHHQIFPRAGMQVSTHSYYDNKKMELNFPMMYDSISRLPPSTVVLLQACCHNPTGLDLSLAQWKEMSDLFTKQRLIPFFDLSYQGFGHSLDGDAQGVRLFLQEGHEMLVAYSCSKNFGLYGERVGLIAAVANDKDAMNRVGSQIKQIIRCTYSMASLQGARIVALILQTKELRTVWEKELTSMRERIEGMRRLFVSKLSEQNPSIDFSYLSEQKGMFSYSGLTPEQVMRLQKEYGIYILSNGRINVAGLNDNIDYVVDAISEVLGS